MRKPILAAGAALALLLVGCGAKEDNADKVASISTPPATSSPSAAGNNGGPMSAADEDKMRAFAKCMREHGVDMPDPQPGNGGGISMRMDGAPADSGKMDAAQEACKHLLPNGGVPKPVDPATLDKMRKQAKCMRDHGVDMPDPTPDGRGTIKVGSGSDDPAKMQAAMKACGMGEGGPMVQAVPVK